MNEPEPKAICGLCGEPMPKDEEMFNYHGYSGPCPTLPLPKNVSVPPPSTEFIQEWRRVLASREMEGVNAVGKHVFLDALMRLEAAEAVLTELIKKYGVKP